MATGKKTLLEFFTKNSTSEELDCTDSSHSDTDEEEAVESTKKKVQAVILLVVEGEIYVV